MIDFAADLELVMDGGDLPRTSGTFDAGGGNTKTIAMVRTQRARGGAPGELDEDVCEFVAEAIDFADGFSVSSPVRPGRGMTFTPTGEVAWRVEEASELGLGAGWILRCSRRRGAGAA